MSLVLGIWGGIEGGADRGGRALHPGEGWGVGLTLALSTRSHPGSHPERCRCLSKHRHSRISSPCNHVIPGIGFSPRHNPVVPGAGSHPLRSPVLVEWRGNQQCMDQWHAAFGNGLPQADGPAIETTIWIRHRWILYGIRLLCVLGLAWIYGMASLLFYNQPHPNPPQNTTNFREGEQIPLSILVEMGSRILLSLWERAKEQWCSIIS